MQAHFFAICTDVLKEKFGKTCRGMILPPTPESNLHLRLPCWFGPIWAGICIFAYSSVIASMLTSVMEKVAIQHVRVHRMQFQQHHLHDIGSHSHLKYQLHLSFFPLPHHLWWHPLGSPASSVFCCWETPPLWHLCC